MACETEVLKIQCPSKKEQFLICIISLETSVFIYKLYVFATDRIIINLTLCSLFYEKALNTLYLSNRDKKSPVIRSSIQEF